MNKKLRVLVVLSEKNRIIIVRERSHHGYNGSDKNQRRVIGLLTHLPYEIYPSSLGGNIIEWN